MKPCRTFFSQTIAVLLLVATGFGIAVGAHAEELGKNEVATKFSSLSYQEFVDKFTANDPAGKKCKRIEVQIDQEWFDDDEYLYIDVPAGWYRIKYSDWQAPAKQDPNNVEEDDDHLIFNDPWHTRQFFCDPATAAQFEDAPGLIKEYAIWFVNGVLTIFANVGIWLLWLAGNIVGVLLAQNVFINHPFVRTGWPFLLGIANLCFVLVLLFIAFATTLQLDMGGGVRRWLPRLFFAAVLINFSLIIGGLLIDVSRLIMAAIANVLGDIPNLSVIGDRLIANSGIVNEVFQKTSLTEDYAWVESTQGSHSWLIPFKTLQATILIWGIMVGMWVAAGFLFARYIMLILLLIASPMAYLAGAIPNMASISTRWWSAFLKWTFYGPIVLFLLVLAAYLGGSSLTGSPSDKSAAAGLINLVMTIAVLASSAFIGRSLGVAGAGAAINLTRNTARRARNYAYRGTQAAASTAVRGTVGAAKIVDDQLGRRTGVGVQRGMSSVRDFMNLRTQARTRQATQQERQRGQQSLGSRVGSRIYQTPQQRQQRTQEQQLVANVQQAHRNNPHNATDAALDPRNLRNETVGRAVSADQLNAILNAPSSARRDSQIANMVNNTQIVNNLTTDQRNRIQDNAERIISRPIHPTDTPAEIAEADRQRKFAGKILSDLHATLRRAQTPPTTT